MPHTAIIKTSVFHLHTAVSHYTSMGTQYFSTHWTVSFAFLVFQLGVHVRIDGKHVAVVFGICLATEVESLECQYAVRLLPAPGDSRFLSEKVSLHGHPLVRQLLLWFDGERLALFLAFFGDDRRPRVFDCNTRNCLTTGWCSLFNFSC